MEEYLDTRLLQRILNVILGVTESAWGVHPDLSAHIYLQQIRDAYLGVTSTHYGNLDNAVYLQQIRDAVLGISGTKFGDLSEVVYWQQIYDAFSGTTSTKHGNLDANIYLKKILGVAHTSGVILPKNLLTNPGYLAENFEVIGDWSFTGAGGAVSDDAVNFVTGAHSVINSAAASVTCYVQKTVSLNMSAFGRGLCYFRHVATQGDNPTLYFCSDAAFANYIRYKLIYTPYASLGWNCFHFHQSQMIDDGSSPNLAAIIRFRCRQVPPAAARNVNFDSLYLGMAGVPAIYFQFEDCRAPHYDAAVYMAAHNMRGTFSIVSDLVGMGGRLTWAQLRSMESMGHCIINATKDHTSMGGMAEAAQEAELTNCRDAGLANGIWTGANANNWRYMSYPSGSYDANTLVAFNAVGMRLGWNMIGTGTMFGMPFGQKYMLPFTHLTIAKAIGDLQTYINTTITTGMLFMCYLEDLGGASVSLATLELMFDYLASKGTQIYTVTADDLYRLQSGPITIPTPK